MISWAEKWHTIGEITTSWKDFIKNRDAQPGKNSTLYKTHKIGTPVRLLTTGCNTAIENLSKFIERVCAPLSCKIPTRISATSHLLDLIVSINETGLPENFILVSFDIINMFPSIDNVKGMQAVRDALETRETLKPSTTYIIEALEICLYNNNSVFSDQNLLQINGTATGSPNSCSYSDLAIYPLDKKILSAKQTEFSELYYFGRYREDCFGIWTDIGGKLHKFLEFLNNFDSKLQFTMEIGYDTLCFLDLKISVLDGQLFTTVYSKPTDSHIYLHSTSFHKRSSIIGIQKGVALSLKRICSTEEEYKLKSKEYSVYLISRRHNAKSVSNIFYSLSNTSRNEARQKKVKNNDRNMVLYNDF